MPIYQYECKSKRCKHITEKFHRMDSIPKQARCEQCGKMARRIIPQSGAIQCDSINDVKWLPSACQTLQRHGEPPLQSRTEYNAYLKKTNQSCIG